MYPVAAHFPLRMPLQPNEPPTQAQLVKKVALAVFAEMALCAALTAAISLFVATPVGITFLLSALAIHIAVSISLRTLSSFALQHAQKQLLPDLQQQDLAKGADTLRALTFASLIGYNTQSLIHEAGHAIAAKAVYIPGNPKIEIYPFKGAVTHFSMKKLTPFGKRLGLRGSELLVGAGGPALALLVSTACLWMASAVRRKHPNLAMYLTAYAISDFGSHAWYALSTYWTSPQNHAHDFVRLAHLGVHPLRAALGIAAVPLLIASAGAAVQSQSKKPTTFSE